MDRHSEAARVFDAAQVEDLGAGGRHFQHFFRGDLVDLAGGGDHARVGGVDAVDVRVDFADVSFQGGGQGDGGGVGAAAAHGGDVFGLWAHALEAGDDGDVAPVQCGLHAVGRDVNDTGLAMQGVGEHAGLGTGEGLGGGSGGVNGHSE